MPSGFQGAVRPTSPRPASEAGAPSAAETKPADAKPAEAKPADVPVFALDKLVLPEGLAKDDPALGAFSDVIKGMPQDKAQALIDLYTKQAQASSETATKAWEAINEKWQSEVKADPTIGGDKLPGVLSTINKALDMYGTPGLKAALNLTGVGNNPDLVKTLHNMAKALTEGSHVAGAPASRQQSAAKMLYPNLP